jgi:hypothetical protein
MEAAQDGDQWLDSVLEVLNLRKFTKALVPLLLIETHTRSPAYGRTCNKFDFNLSIYIHLNH